MKKWLILWICPLCFFFSSCADDLNDNQNENAKNQIHCTVNVADRFMTKGTPVNSATDETFKTLGILGYHTLDKFAADETATSDFLPNLQIKKSGTNTWLFDKLHYWPQKGYVSFFAYAPYATSQNGITIQNSQGHTPVLTYSVPHSAADQPDLMIAVPQIDKSRQEIPLDFTHALACIGFDVSGENVPIESIGIKGVYTTGTLMLNMTGKLPEWKNLSGLNADLFSVGLVDDPVANNPSTGVMATNGYLMMIPQQLSADAAIVIKFKGIDAKIIPLKNAGTTEWIAGNKYMYSLKEGVYNLSVVPTNSSVDYLGGTFGLTINSTYTKQNGVVDNIGWTAEIISSSNGNSAWVKGMENLINQAGGTGLSRILSAGISQYNTTSPMDNFLQQQPVIPKENMMDLSFIGNHYTSSNCYIVNGPGWYKFPCWIMGNGLSSSSSSSYTTSSSSLNDDCFRKTPPYFMNYKGGSITSPNDLILETSGTSAQLIWMDALNLITDISLTPDQQYISFYVDPTTIRQGNAVIALKDASGDIMWSWHIWVNEWSLKLSAYNGYVWYFANNIGVCYPATYNYPNQSVTIQFTQQQSNMTTEVTLTQTPEVISVYLNNPYYQWGRKDPMPGSYGNTAQTKPLYGPDGFVSFKTQPGPVSMSEAIKNPDIFYTSPVSWNSDDNMYMWGDATLPSYPKSIYDPSPVGLVVPSYDMLKQLEPQKWNDNYAGLGFLYTYPSGYSTIYFMGIGQRIGATGDISPNFYNNGYYWTNQSVGGGMYYNMSVSKATSTATFTPAGTSQGMSIQPVQNSPYPN